jgi:hypothetical protein
VPHPTDETDANTLPDPELNPLLNPLLAAHMGRWAEAYFTAPPEKREEAVAELLRALRNDSAAEPVSAAVVVPAVAPVVNPVTERVVNPVIDPLISDEEERRKKAATEAGAKSEAGVEEPPDLPPDAVEAVRNCDVCAHQNAAGQLFCGMCGYRLQVQTETVTPPVVEGTPVSTAQRSESQPAPSGSFHDYAIEPEISHAERVERETPEAAWPPQERSIPHFLMEAEPESVPHRLRLYIGIVLAMLLVLLVYMARRGTQAISGTAGTQSGVSRAIPPAPSAEPPAAPAASAQPSTTESASSKSQPAGPNTLGSASSEAAPPASRPRTKKRPAPASRNSRHSSPRRASPPMSMAASSSPIAADSSGAEELAWAERYLNGTQGMPRDSREAAQWLWKAVGKGNAAATITLSDLYMRGDGVSKSCDQARLLLDAAARKGARAAAERLRNLPAFGCN